MGDFVEPEMLISGKGRKGKERGKEREGKGRKGKRREGKERKHPQTQPGAQRWVWAAAAK